MAPKVYKYNAIIQKVPDIDGAYVEFPYDIKEEFGKGIKGTLLAVVYYSPQT